MSDRILFGLTKAAKRKQGPLVATFGECTVGRGPKTSAGRLTHANAVYRPVKWRTSIVVIKVVKLKLRVVVVVNAGVGGHSNGASRAPGTGDSWTGHQDGEGELKYNKCRVRVRNVTVSLVKQPAALRMQASRW
jgi:hypothetical protein